MNFRKVLGNTEGEGIDGVILFDFPHCRHCNGDETDKTGFVTGYDNSVGRFSKVAGPLHFAG